jgi:hypothetical protein
MKVNPDGRRHRRKSMNAERRRTRDGRWSLTRCRLQGAMAHRRLQADQRRGSCRDFLNVRWQRRWRAAGTSSIGRIDAATGVVTTTPTTDGSTTVAPRSITVASDGQVWFTARFTPQAVGRLDPTTGAMTIFPTPTNPGPQDIAASPDGTLWFTQATKGNIARIDNAGVITEAKAVKGSEPFGITVAPNGDPWYTMFAASKLATLQLRLENRSESSCKLAATLALIPVLLLQGLLRPPASSTSVVPVALQRPALDAVSARHPQHGKGGLHRERRVPGR